MLPSHSKATKQILTHGGVGLAGALSVAAGAGFILAGPAVSIGLSAAALLSFAIAGYGALAREDIKKVHRLVVRNATAEDIERLQSRLSAFTPSAVPIADRLKIAAKNSSCFRVVEDLRDDGEWRKTLDILAIYPLTEEAAADVREGRLVGADIRAKHVTASFRKAAGLYVSFAEGRSQLSRGELLKEIDRNILGVKRRPLLIAGIPTTVEAMRLVTRRGFHSLEGRAPRMKEVCILIVEQQTP